MLLRANYMGQIFSQLFHLISSAVTLLIKKKFPLRSQMGEGSAIACYLHGTNIFPTFPPHKQCCAPATRNIFPTSIIAVGICYSRYPHVHALLTRCRQRSPHTHTHTLARTHNTFDAKNNKKPIKAWTV